MRTPYLTCLAAACVASVLIGCSGGDSQDRLEEVSAENQQLRERDAKQDAELRELRKKVDVLDIQVRNLEKTVAKAEEDLRSRIKEMVQQETGGRRRWVRRPPEVEPRFEVKPFMGFDAQDLLPDVAEHLKLKAKTGVLVTDVRPGSPAAVAGLAKHDVIQSFDGQEIKDFKDLKKAFADKKPGEVVTMAVLRGEKKVELKIKLGAKKVRVG